MNHSIHPEARIGAVHLTTADLDRSLAFYQQVLGLTIQAREGGCTRLGAGAHSGASLLVLNENPAARRVSRTTGLYHFAVLVPSRLELAQALRRIASTRTLVQGFADHGVSEAVYLSDPDGNGIEIYRDRPRAQWPRRDGQLQMVTDPLDFEGVMAALDRHVEIPATLPPETVIGHVHLHVADISQAETFYRDVVGFDLMQRFEDSASFLSAGGYHHHVGLNTWAGVGAPPPPPDAIGLRWYEIKLPDAASVGQVADRVRAAGLNIEECEEGLLLRDPSQNGVMLAVA